MPPKEEKKVVVRLTQAKECKGSIRYETQDAKAVISNVYLSRTFADPMPESIDISISPV